METRLSVLGLGTNACALQLEEVHPGLQQILAIGPVRRTGSVHVRRLRTIGEYPDLDAASGQAGQHVTSEGARNKEGRHDQELLTDLVLESGLQSVGQFGAFRGLSQTFCWIIDHQMRAGPDEG